MALSDRWRSEASHSAQKASCLQSGLSSRTESPAKRAKIQQIDRRSVTSPDILTIEDCSLKGKSSLEGEPKNVLPKRNFSIRSQTGNFFAFCYLSCGKYSTFQSRFFFSFVPFMLFSVALSLPSSVVLLP